MIDGVGNQKKSLAVTWMKWCHWSQNFDDYYFSLICKVTVSVCNFFLTRKVEGTFDARLNLNFKFTINLKSAKFH